MKHFIATGIAALVIGSAADAQVYVRAPFVRVGVGGPGVSVRAPFVNLFIPNNQPAYYPQPVYPGPGYPAPGYYAPGYYGPGYGGSGAIVPRYYSSDYRLPPSLPSYVPLPPSEPAFVPPTPKIVERPPALPPELPEPRDVEPPPATGPFGVLTVDEFVKTFKARAGSFEIDLVNPVTKRPTNVRFTLPDGMLKSVQYRGNTVEFSYGPLRFVRIDFDKDGAVVTSR